MDVTRLILRAGLSSLGRLTDRSHRKAQRIKRSRLDVHRRRCTNQSISSLSRLHLLT